MERKPSLCLSRRLIYLYILMSCKHAHEDTESGINLFFSYLRCDTARGYTGNPREIGGSCAQGGMFL